MLNTHRSGAQPARSVSRLPALRSDFGHTFLSGSMVCGSYASGMSLFSRKSALPTADNALTGRDDGQNREQEKQGVPLGPEALTRESDRYKC